MIGVVYVDNPPVNVLSHNVRQGLYYAITELEADRTIKVAIIACRGRTFIAGADIREFGKPAEKPLVTDIALAMEKSKKIWVAAVHGTTLGGGFEVILGCHYRVALASAKLGFPEVTLGIIPGAGGTVRLPILSGYEFAAKIITHGRPVSTDKALAHSVVDAVFDDNLIKNTLDFAHRIVEKPLPHPLGQRPWGKMPAKEFWQNLRSTLQKKHATAALKAVEIMQNSHNLSFDAAIKIERDTFRSLRESAQSIALRAVFFAERSSAKPQEIKNITPLDIQKSGVIGGGLMGCGIALNLLRAGCQVKLIEQDVPSAQRTKKRIHDLLNKDCAQARLSADAHTQAYQNLQVGINMEMLHDTDLVIEAIFEDFEAKKRVFERLDGSLPQATIIATNTSYLDLDALATVSKRADRFLGLHFFSPAHIMKTVEVVRGKHSSPMTIASGFHLARRLNKIPIITGVCAGFVGNRLLKIYRHEAENLLVRGQSVSQIDRALRDFGYPMGVFEAQDMGGLDIAWQMRRAAPCGQKIHAPIADTLCEMGRFGVKTGGGWYDYDDCSRAPKPSAVTKQIIAQQRTENAAMTTQDIQNYLLFPMIDEACNILQEGIARRAQDIDLVKIHGYGFPRWRGGLMFFARQLGVAKITQSLNARGYPPSKSLEKILAS